MMSFPHDLRQQRKKHDELAMRIEEIETRGQNLRHFQETLESLNGQVTEFDSDLWGSLVDYIRFMRTEKKQLLSEMEV